MGARWLGPMVGGTGALLKSSVLLRLMAPLTALKEAAPLTVSAVLAAWVMLPAALMLRAPLLTEILPRLRAWLLASVALPAALVDRVTVPLRALAALAWVMEPLA